MHQQNNLRVSEFSKLYLISCTMWWISIKCSNCIFLKIEWKDQQVISSTTSGSNDGLHMLHVLDPYDLIKMLLSYNSQPNDVRDDIE